MKFSDFIKFRSGFKFVIFLQQELVTILELKRIQKTCCVSLS